MVGSRAMAPKRATGKQAVKAEKKNHAPILDQENAALATGEVVPKSLWSNTILGTMMAF